MNAQLLDGRAVAAKVRAEVAAAVAAERDQAGRPPGLVAVLAGDDPASELYVESKRKAAREVGIDGRIERLPAETSEHELLDRIERLNRDDSVDGVLVQLPLPDAIDSHRVIQSVAVDKDVDGFHAANVGALWQGLPCLAPATPSGVIRLLEDSGQPWRQSRAVVVGRSNIVGKPMAALLLANHCTVTVCHSRTRDLAAICRRAELLVVAAGRPALIGAEHVADGAVVVDVGTHRLTDRSQVEQLFSSMPRKLRAYERNGSVLCGDVDFAAVAPGAAAITPVPGGVGPMTIAMLLSNTLQAWRSRRDRALAVEASP